MATVAARSAESSSHLPPKIVRFENVSTKVSRNSASGTTQTSGSAPRSVLIFDVTASISDDGRNARSAQKAMADISGRSARDCTA